MNEQKQRIAIAESCGYAPYQGNWATPDDRDIVAYNELPDYLNDLNAMHEAEKVLTPDLAKCYAEAIDDFINPCIEYGYNNLWGGVFQAVHAPASLRAEAFLRTIGKWEESWTAEDEKDKARHRCQFEGEPGAPFDEPLGEKEGE